MPSKPQPPRLFLKGHVLNEMLQRIALHAELLRMVKEGLPGPLASHCQYCVAREDGGLVVFSDSQAVASQLRFYAPSILAKLNVNLETPIKQISVKNLQPTPPATAAKPMKPVSLGTIETVKASSNAAPCDELAMALAKLGAAMERHAVEKT